MRNEAYLREEYVKEYVKDHIRIGQTFNAYRDVYNTDHRRLDDLTERTVIGFYDNYVLTLDDFGKKETYMYFDMYQYLRGVVGET